MTPPPDKPSLRRVLRVKDLVFFYVTAVLGMRWVATAAASGPSALLIWVFATLSLFVPLAYTVIELSSRYPDEGGIYVWTKRAFGDFGGFMTGWTYWGANLTYLPGLLYFTASTALYVFGSRYAHLQDSPTYFIAVAMIGLIIAAAMNIVGLEVGKWLSVAGALGAWLPMLLLIVMGLVAWAKFGSATPITPHSLLPATGLRDMVFWSTIAFAFTGLEAGSFMGEEIVEPRRTISRAVLIAGVSIAVIYILGTLAILLALPQAEITGLGGIMDAITATGSRIGVTGLAPIAATLIVLSNLGGVGVWLAAPARLPFVAGIDRYLPSAFGRLHPRYGTPHVDPARLARARHVRGRGGARVCSPAGGNGRAALRDQGGGAECPAGGKRCGRLGDRQRAPARGGTYRVMAAMPRAINTSAPQIRASNTIAPSTALRVRARSPLR